LLWNRGQTIKKALFILAILSLLLTACSQKVDLYFESDQRWRAEIAFTVDQAMLDLIMQFGGMAIAEELNLPDLPSSILESETWIGLALDKLAREWENNGIETRWTRAGNTYTIFLRGEGYAQLQSVTFDAVMVMPVADSPETYQLTGNFGFPNDDFSILATGLFGYESIVSVHAGHILDCNGCEINGGTAAWRNPGTVQVTFTPSRPFSFPWQILLGILGMMVVIGIVVFVVSRASGVACPQCGRRVRKGQDICQNCGAYVTAYKDLMDV
jgi:hypothetical protein